MYTKYIILFCLTCNYNPSVISYDNYTFEIMKRFNEIRNENENYVTFRSMRKIYEDYEIDELEYLLDNYGVEITGDNGYYERRVYFDKFTEVARRGIVHKYKTWGMINLFFNIITTRDKGYITRSDLVNYYQTRIPQHQIDKIMTSFGIAKPDGIRLGFYGFRRAINTLNIQVLSDEIGSLLILL